MDKQPDRRHLIGFRRDRRAKAVFVFQVGPQWNNERRLGVLS
jgi:hypothetical protein